jgi:hypothetical protein
MLSLLLISLMIENSRAYFYSQTGLADLQVSKPASELPETEITISSILKCQSKSKFVDVQQKKSLCGGVDTNNLMQPTGFRMGTGEGIARNSQGIWEMRWSLEGC